jgi:hypothetical protein
MTIDSQHGRRVFVLEVAGLKVRYMSHDLDLSGSNLAQNIATGIAYQNVTGLVAVGPFSGSIDPAGGIASYQGVSVTLASRGARGGATDPHVVFGRCGSRSDVAKAKLTQAIKYQTNAPIIAQVDRDLRAAISTPAIVHIGAESFRCTGVTAATLVLATRAVGGSQRQAHNITLGGTNSPEVTTEITTFRGRRCSLFAAHQYPDGGLSDFVQVVNGFIDNTPEVEEASEVSFSILPLVALASSASAAIGVTTNLLQDFHYFATTGNHLEWAWNLDGTPQRARITSIDTGVTPHVAQLDVDIAQEIGRLFDLTLPHGDAGVHPRFPLLSVIGSSRTVAPISITSNAPGTGCALAFDAAAVNLFVNDYLELRPQVEIKRIKIAEETLVQWTQALNAQLQLTLSTTQGVNGQWGRWALDGSDVVAVPNADATPFKTQMLMWSAREKVEPLRGRYWTAAAPYPALDDYLRLNYPIQLTEQATLDIGRAGASNRNGPQVLLESTLGRTGRTRSSRIPLGGVALAWYQIVEPVILVEGTIGLPSAPDGNDYDVEVKYFNRVAGEMQKQWFKATHETTASFQGDAVGVYIHLSRDVYLNGNNSFGDWPGHERCLISRGARYDQIRPGELLLRLLESGGGFEVNGDYDLFPIGLGIASSEIDEASFIAYDSTALFSLSGDISSEGADIEEQISGVLKMMGCALIMHRDQTTGSSLLRLQPLGAENRRFLDATITEADWIADPPPRWSTFEDIVTQVVYQFEWDEIEGKYRASRTFTNQEAVNRYGGELKKIDISVRGLQLADIGDGAGDSFGFFLPTSARLFNLFSNPAREWTGSIGTGASMFLDVGSYVGVTSKHLKAYEDSFGVTDGIGFVKALHQDLMGEGCQLEMIALGLEPVAWNASALVTATPDASSVTIASAQFSEDDASFFQAGDVVDYLPEADEDSALAGLIIASVVGQTITFTTNHGISAAGGTLEPTTYADASTTHKADAYLASNDALPVLASDQAQNYA